MENNLTPEEQQIYLEQLMENYRNPKNFGKLENPTFSHHIKNTTCGDSFDIYVKLSPHNRKIKEVKFFGEGCAISTASMSLLTQKLKGMNFKKAKELEEKDIRDILGIKISPGRINCAMLSLNAFREATDKFQEQQNTTIEPTTETELTNTTDK